MYIRRTKTKTLDQGEAYYTYRIVESVRIGNQVKQRTVLNLALCPMNAQPCVFIVDDDYLNTLLKGYRFANNIEH